MDRPKGKRSWKYIELRRESRRFSYLNNRDELNQQRRDKRSKEREINGIHARKNNLSPEFVKERWERWKIDNPDFSRRKKPEPKDSKAEYNGWSMKAVYRSKHRAAEKNVPFNIEESDLNDPETNKLPVFCSILPYIRLDYSGGKDKRRWASVDRIKPKLGYAKGNVRVISMAANMAKSDGEGDVFVSKPIPKIKHTMPDQPSLFDGL